MPVQKDPDGRRSVQAEVDVPGTPEEVWQAIATGPGISSWFVPSEVEERVGGTASSHFGPGMDAVGTITAWEPPHRYVVENPGEVGPDDPPVATEWTIAARSGGTCVVRVVHAWFTSSDAWDEQFEGHTYGWIAFFRILRLYLSDFAGQSAIPVQVMGVAPEPKEDAWTALMAALGFAGAAVGRRVQTAAGAPPLTGVVAWAGHPAWPEELLLRLEEPAPGMAHVSAHAMGGQVFLVIRLFFFGGDAAAAAAGAEPVWQEWLQERFPMPVEAAV